MGTVINFLWVKRAFTILKWFKFLKRIYLKKCLCNINSLTTVFYFSIYYNYQGSITKIKKNYLILHIYLYFKVNLYIKLCVWDGEMQDSVSKNTCWYVKKCEVKTLLYTLNFSEQEND